MWMHGLLTSRLHPLQFVLSLVPRRWRLSLLVLGLAIHSTRYYTSALMHMLLATQLLGCGCPIIIFTSKV